MELHASCASRDGAGVLLLGPSGAGKSDLLLRLLDHGFALVADDRVIVEEGVARAPAQGAGLLEVRGLGIFMMPYVERAKVRLAVGLGPERSIRLPRPSARHFPGVPNIVLDPSRHSAAACVRLAVDSLLGRFRQLAGFAVE